MWNIFSRILKPIEVFQDRCWHGSGLRHTLRVLAAKGVALVSVRDSRLTPIPSPESANLCKAQIWPCSSLDEVQARRCTTHSPPSMTNGSVHSAVSPFTPNSLFTIRAEIRCQEVTFDFTILSSSWSCLCDLYSCRNDGDTVLNCPARSMPS